MNDLIKIHDNTPECFPFDWASQWGKDRYGLWVAFTYKNVTQCFRWITPGKFMMGSPESEPERQERERLHEVILTKGFWLADTVCTQALWLAVMGENPSKFEGAQRPVEQVSWNDCSTFIDKINKLKPGLNLRLPSEAEWEYASRAGTVSPFSFGDNVTTDQVNYDGRYPYNGGKKGHFRGETVEVKALPCNKWGLYQMHGNVWEWCADWFGNYPTDIAIDPTGTANGTDRVLRGGSWFFTGKCARSAYRLGDQPSVSFSVSCFRLARGPELEGESRQTVGNLGE